MRKTVRELWGRSRPWSWPPRSRRRPRCLAPWPSTRRAATARASGSRPTPRPPSRPRPRAPGSRETRAAAPGARLGADAADAAATRANAAAAPGVVPPPVIGSHQIDRYDAIDKEQKVLEADNPKSLADWIILGELAHEVAMDAPADAGGQVLQDVERRLRERPGAGPEQRRPEGGRPVRPRPAAARRRASRSRATAIPTPS